MGLLTFSKLEAKPKYVGSSKRKDSSWTNSHDLADACLVQASKPDLLLKAQSAPTSGSSKP